MSHDYPWYGIISPGESFEQGDFIEDCPVLVPSSNPVSPDQQMPVEVVTTNVVIMSQSCDLKDGDIEFVLACPVASAEGLGLGREKLETIRKGSRPAYHMVKNCDLHDAPDFSKTCQIVDFRNVYSIEFSFLKKFASSKPRLRLLPPYREHLSQAFARFFMRVGLPSDIPSFK